MPLAHCYERFLELLIMESGGKVGYLSGDITQLIADLQILQPTFMPSVPRILNRLHSALRAQFASATGLKGALIRRAVATKLANHAENGSITHPVYDKLVFSKVRALLGGKVNRISSGSAPISPEVLSFLRVTLCSDVVEGYGSTEGVGTASVNYPGDLTSAGSVVSNDQGYLIISALTSHSSRVPPNPSTRSCS